MENGFFRGAQPGAIGLKDLQALGVSIIIDLREPGGSTTLERTEADRLGLKYVNVPFRSMSAPTLAQVQTVLALVKNRGQASVFLHCRRGKDRTGTVVACYRIEYNRWESSRAIAEADQYGMSRAERGMRSFISRFQAVASPASFPVIQPGPSVIPDKP